MGTSESCISPRRRYRSTWDDDSNHEEHDVHEGHEMAFVQNVSVFFESFVTFVVKL